MFTANFYNIRANYLMTGNYLGADNIKAYDGASIASRCFYSVPGKLSDLMTAFCKSTKANAKTFQNQNTVSDVWGVIFGDGDTAPSMNDYQMAGEHLSAYAASSVVSTEATSDSITITRTYTITNDMDTEFTIREVGLTTHISKSSSSSAHRMPILLERTLLDTPVTIPAGGIGQVTYTIRYECPAA